METNATTQTQFAIRPFRINIPEAELVELRWRIVATRWPEKETVTDQSQGVQISLFCATQPLCTRILPTGKISCDVM